MDEEDHEWRFPSSEGICVLCLKPEPTKSSPLEVLAMLAAERPLTYSLEESHPDSLDAIWQAA
jgi:hypothetical protein